MTGRHGPGLAIPLSLIAVLVSAVVIDPPVGDTPILAPEGRTFFIICLLAALIIVGSRLVRRGKAADGIARDISFGILVSTAPALFLPGRVGPFWIIAFIVLTVLLAAFDSEPLREKVRLPPEIGTILVIALTWFSIAGIATFQFPARLAMPLTALVAVTAATCVLSKVPGRKEASLLATVAFIGAELIFALKFMPWNPLAIASVWVLAVIATFAVIAITQMRVRS